MLSFNLQSHRVVIDPLSVTISELREIYDADETPLKRTATDILTYIHLASRIDPNSPFYDAREDEVEKIVAKNIWGDRKSESEFKEYRAVIIAYQAAFEKAEDRVIRGFGSKIDEFQDTLEDTVPVIRETTNSKTGAVSFSSNTGFIMKIMKEIRFMIVEKKELEDLVRQTSDSEVKRWGGKQESYLEKRKSKKKVNEERTPEANEKPESKVPNKAQRQGVSEEVSKIPIKF